MKICPKCNEGHDKPGIYCSRSCANSRPWSEETNKKRSAAMVGRTGWQNNEPDKWKETIDKGSNTKLQKYLTTSFDDLGLSNKRRRVFEEQGHSCNRCKRTEWEGFSIPLELEHKDANKKNNSRDNLEGLCPNCHALTPTWKRGAKRPNNSLILSGTTKFN